MYYGIVKTVNCIKQIWKPQSNSPYLRIFLDLKIYKNGEKGFSKMFLKKGSKEYAFNTVVLNGNLRWKIIYVSLRGRKRDWSWIALQN